MSKTFDGEHPCPLCMAVKKAVEPGNSDTEKQLPPSKVKEIKLMLAMCQVPIFAFPARLPHRWQAWNESA
ncbi:MAG: hypothetical protein LDL31_09710, partial [Prosthecobacter sp.]|nr:hypothetical protein [Prosthecobacter sp.]